MRLFLRCKNNRWLSHNRSEEHIRKFQSIGAKLWVRTQDLLESVREFGGRGCTSGDGRATRRTLGVRTRYPCTNTAPAPAPVPWDGMCWPKKFVSRLPPPPQQLASICIQGMTEMGRHHPDPKNQETVKMVFVQAAQRQGSERCLVFDESLLLLTFDTSKTDSAP